MFVVFIVVECIALGYFLMSDTHRNHLGQTSAPTLGWLKWLRCLSNMNTIRGRLAVTHWTPDVAQSLQPLQSTLRRSVLRWFSGSCRMAEAPIRNAFFAIKMSKSYDRFQIYTFLSNANKVDLWIRPWIVLTFYQSSIVLVAVSCVRWRLEKHLNVVIVLPIRQLCVRLSLCTYVHIVRLDPLLHRLFWLYQVFCLQYVAYSCILHWDGLSVKIRLYVSQTSVS